MSSFHARSPEQKPLENFLKGLRRDGLSFIFDNPVEILSTLTVSGALVLGGALSVTGDFAVNTNKFTVEASSGNTAVAGTLSVTGAISGPGGGITGLNASALASGNVPYARMPTGSGSWDTGASTTLTVTRNLAVGGTFGVTGQTSLAAGTAANPGARFGGVETGLFQAANTLGFSEGGQRRGSVVSGVWFFGGGSTPGTATAGGFRTNGVSNFGSNVDIDGTSYIGWGNQFATISGSNAYVGSWGLVFNAAGGIAYHANATGFYPHTDNVRALGGASNRWSHLHTVNATFGGTISAAGLPTSAGVSGTLWVDGSGFVKRA